VDPGVLECLAGQSTQRLRFHEIAQLTYRNAFSKWFSSLQSLPSKSGGPLHTQGIFKRLVGLLVTHPRPCVSGATEMPSSSLAKVN
jgi:hypothetical protein